jgi:predicted Rossmann fold flavoprotein
MPKIIPFAIIGAGPAGMAAAIAYGKGAVILERNPEAGKKLLLSGSGQCNYTNNLSNEDFIRACRKAGPFLKRALYNADSGFFTELLDKAGCPGYVREDGKVFPASLKAEHVRDALLQTALRKGAEILYEAKVSGVRKEKAGFILQTGCGTMHSRKLLLACGGSSWPQTGSSGDSYAFAGAMGHTVSPVRPALAAIETDNYAPYVQCAGIALYDLKAEFITKTGKHRDTGDLLFTHTGLSGPLILNNSHLLEKSDTVRLRLLPGAETVIHNAVNQGSARHLLNALKAVPLPNALLEAILIGNGLNPDSPFSSLSAKQRNLIISALQYLEFRISKVEGLQTSMSTAGGVLLKEVNSATLESRIVPGLYLAGEVLDYALPTGGFNIQTAFSTGWLAGKSAAGNQV